MASLVVLERWIPLWLRIWQFASLKHKNPVRCLSWLRPISAQAYFFIGPTSNLPGADVVVGPMPIIIRMHSSSFAPS